ncbi:MAG: hypothetical protein LBT47_00205 [Deltaproteobacteria bacterium]|jgi:hypothetical protein|nr:hypothetical protein [Deltaproteobacteria bacterium]
MSQFNSPIRIHLTPQKTLFPQPGRLFSSSKNNGHGPFFGLSDRQSAAAALVQRFSGFRNSIFTRTLLVTLFLFLTLFFSLFFSESSFAYLRSDYLGGWPGLCEDGQCYDDGTPFSEPPVDSRRRILEHQLASPSCPTDLVFIYIDYPENTGSPALDRRLASAMDKRFAAAKRQALELTCNDFDGCLGQCLPVSIELRQYVHQSSPSYLSIFQVERFIGNFRRNRHIRGTVSYTFINYSLITGAPLTLKDIFLNPNRGVPQFWAKVNELLAASDNCSIDQMRVSGRRISKVHLTTNDLILNRGGATIALTAPKAGTCRSQALDIDLETMIELGARPALWRR